MPQSVWEQIRSQQEALEEDFRNEGFFTEEEEEEEEYGDTPENYVPEYEYDYESDDEDYDTQLLSAQQQWEESIEQLSKVLDWVLLPLLGKFLGRRVALKLWRDFMDYVW